MINFRWEGNERVAIYLNRTSQQIDKNLKLGLRETSSLLQKEVKDKFGKYQMGWPRLKRATVIAKYRRKLGKGGYRSVRLNNGSVPTGRHDPLKLFGDLEKSIKKKTTSDEAIVYSDNEYSAVHEYGYAPKGVPSRSYMRLTLDENENEISNIFNKYIRRAMSD